MLDTIPSVREKIATTSMNVRVLSRIEDGLISLVRRHFDKQNFLLSQNEFYKLFGKQKATRDFVVGRWEALGQDGYLILKEIGNNLEEKISTYVFSPKFRKEINQLFAEYLHAFPNERDLGYYLLDKEEKNNRAERTTRLTTTITVDIRNIGQAIVEGAENGRWMPVVQLANSLQPSNNNEAVGTLKYHEGQNGRLYTDAQNIKKQIRATVFKDWLYYDIRSSAPTILSQFYETTFGKTNDVLLSYINDKKQFQARLAQKVSVDIKDIKKVITSLFFGARVPSERQMAAIDCLKTYQVDFAIEQVVGYEKAKLILDDEQFCLLAESVREMFDEIANKYKGQREVINGNGNILPLPRFDKGKVIHHIYAGEERKILDVIIQFVGTSNVVYIHDGFISKHKVDVSKLELEVKTKTGYQITFDVE